MSFKRKPFLFWFISGCLLIFTAFMPPIFNLLVDQPSKALEPLDITTAIDVPTGRYFQTDGIFHLDMTGTSQMILPIKHLPDNISDYDMLAINNLKSNQAVNLYITAQLVFEQDSLPVAYKHKLINNQESINELSLEWRTASSISDVALVVESEITLGFGNKYDSQVSWRSIFLGTNNIVSQSEKLLNSFSSFVPLNYSSVNLFNGEAIGIYKPLLIWLGTWFFITSTLYLIIRPTPVHLLTSIVLTWFFATLFYAHNFILQGQFNQLRFSSNHHLNHIDQQLFDISKLIDKTLSHQRSAQPPFKILILGGEKFTKNRLNFHLLHYNVGIIDNYNQMLKVSGKASTFTVLLPPYLDKCEYPNQNPEKEGHNLLLNTTQFCLIKL